MSRVMLELPDAYFAAFMTLLLAPGSETLDDLATDTIKLAPKLILNSGLHRVHGGCQKYGDACRCYVAKIAVSQEELTELQKLCSAKSALGTYLQTAQDTLHAHSVVQEIANELPNE